MDKNSFLYTSGDLFLPSYIKKILETPIYGDYDKTPIYLTLWSIMHLISGILTELLLRYYFNILQFKSRLIFGFIIHTLWESWQVIIGMATPLRLTGKSGLFDIIIDTIMFLIGMTITHYSIKNLKIY